MLRQLSMLRPYQRRGVIHQLTVPNNFLWLFMGAGKTVITLTSIAHMLKHGVIRGVLICGPLRVVQSVWEKESRKWEHTKHLTFSYVLGNPQARIRALYRKANIFLINYENICWLLVQLQHYFINRSIPLPFDMLVLDESSKMKNSTAERVKAMVPLIPHFKYRTGLTGSPATNGLIDLHGQFLLIDEGRRLGKNLATFKSNYFRSEGFNGTKAVCTKIGSRLIHQNVADIVLEMKEEDHIKLPSFLSFDIEVELPTKTRKLYDKLEKEFFVELDSGTRLEVENETGKINKLIQMANGATYTNPETRQWEPVHDAKLDALDDILEESAGNPVLLAYLFRMDAYRIQKRFPFAKTLTGVTHAEFNKTIDDFSQGRISLLMGHPASMGHGTDGLQHGGKILVWFGIPWSLEYFLQFNKRIHRQGQTEPVRSYRILAKDTMDYAVSKALEYKTITQDTLRDAVAKYRKERGL